jgi:hypothetical protein
MLSEQAQRFGVNTPLRGVFQRDHDAVANADVARTLAGSLQRAVQLLRDAERFAERGTVSAVAMSGLGSRAFISRPRKIIRTTVRRASPRHREGGGAATVRATVNE